MSIHQHGYHLIDQNLDVNWVVKVWDGRSVECEVEMEESGCYCGWNVKRWIVDHCCCHLVNRMNQKLWWML